ncbi:ferrous iron transport protein B [Desulforamulus hydrothermalis]|uniref:Ferrous iron transport protein B n=1 Tax=Desulforamulus hydrothermalis Lam5 = DSM 18033 TaxID=1121428 RepID=K8DZV6_9FIRM|nr:ferrous iron transport protein B [Desulforamulus hydrothermalis]CCO08704.1 Small GTP-binding protein [Desulforamulus hydrothermalis Lam5 = DSM 18033]SHG69605.1 ferrous iron transport protein B [Desulforamulus hydrothermalis Lam5 = DSM 18033]
MNNQSAGQGEAGGKNIVLVGNPNVGKSVFFNYLTGRYTDVANFPGTTTNVICGRFGRHAVTDTPGIYGISSFSEEEKIARDIVLHGDILVNIVDGVHLERDLFLTQQLIDTGLPVLVVINMMDEVRQQGIKIDIPVLSELLGVPVIATVAVEGKGMDQLPGAVRQARTGRRLPLVQEKMAELPAQIPDPDKLLILEGDSAVATRHGMVPGSDRELIYSARRRWVNELVAMSVKETGRGDVWSASLSRWMIQPLTGIPTLIFILWLLYQLIGVFVAQTVVGFTEEVLMGEYFQPAVRDLASRFLAPASPINQILVGDFGVITMTVTYLLGLLFPLVLGFNLVLALLEDSGYLPRIAILLDRLLTSFGLNGQAVIPLVLGFGCVTMALLSTRLLGSERERRIATVILALTVPCSAQLAIITTMLAGLGPGYAVVYGLIIISVFLTGGLVLNRFIPGQSTSLWIDLPPLRLPRPGNVVKKSWLKSTEFITEAAPLFALGAFFLGILEVTGALYAIENALLPLTVNWLGLPKEAAGGFIMGVIRREFGTAGLFVFPMSDMQKMVALTTITLFVPCIASAMVIYKERGWREGTAIWLGVMTVAFFIGGIINQLLNYFTNVLPATSPLTMLAGVIMLGLAVLLGLHRLKPVR